MLPTILVAAGFLAVAFCQCPSEDWINYGGTHKCFKFVEDVASEKEAEKECEQLGGGLVKICSFFENQFVRGITRGRDTWIEKDTSCDYTNFQNGSSPSSKKSCRVMTDDWEGRWKAASCEHEKHNYLCERPALRRPNDPFVANLPTFQMPPLPPQDSEIENFQNQGFQNQGFQNQGFQTQGPQNQGFQNQGFQNQGFQSPQPHLVPTFAVVQQPTFHPRAQVQQSVQRRFVPHFAPPSDWFLQFWRF